MKRRGQQDDDDDDDGVGAERDGVNSDCVR